MFADDTSLFSKTENKDLSTVKMNKNLKVISNWAYQWKILFNPDLNKQAIEVCFSKKHKNVNSSSLFLMMTKFNQSQVKNLGLVLDSKLDFNENINNKIIKCNKIISAMKKLLLTL